MMDDIALIEPYPVMDEFCCGLARIEDLGDAARFVLFSEAVQYEDGNRAVKIVAKKIILPNYAIKPAVELAGRYVARKAARIAGRRLMELVR